MDRLSEMGVLLCGESFSVAGLSVVPEDRLSKGLALAKYDSGCFVEPGGLLFADAGTISRQLDCASRARRPIRPGAPRGSEGSCWRGTGSSVIAPTLLHPGEFLGFAASPLDFVCLLHALVDCLVLHGVLTLYACGLDAPAIQIM